MPASAASFSLVISMCFFGPAPGVASALAAKLQGAGVMLQYQVVDQDIAGVIAGIAAQAGLHADVSSQVHGTVHGRLPQTDLQTALNRLGALYGFDWYSDGQTLYASAYTEIVRKVLPLGAVSAPDLQNTVAAFGISDSRWPIKFSASGNIGFVNGPPRYVALIDDTLSALAAREQSESSLVSVFRGAVAPRL